MLWIQRNENPKYITEISDILDPNALTIGFARRFATYKRAHLLFRDLERLARIVNNPSGHPCSSFSPAKPTRLIKWDRT